MTKPRKKTRKVLQAPFGKRSVAEVHHAHHELAAEPLRPACVFKKRHGSHLSKTIILFEMLRTVGSLSKSLYIGTN